MPRSEPEIEVGIDLSFASTRLRLSFLSSSICSVLRLAIYNLPRTRLQEREFMKRTELSRKKRLKQAESFMVLLALLAVVVALMPARSTPSLSSSAGNASMASNNTQVGEIQAPETSLVCQDEEAMLIIWVALVCAYPHSPIPIHPTLLYAIL